jgi:hypothetical protein
VAGDVVGQGRALAQQAAEVSEVSTDPVPDAGALLAGCGIVEFRQLAVGGKPVQRSPGDRRRSGHAVVVDDGWRGALQLVLVPGAQDALKIVTNLHG